MKLKLLTLSAFALFAASALPISCNKNQEPERVVPERKRPVITDGDATAKTKALFENLIDLEEKGTMFGAQIPTEYGLDGGKKWFDDGSASNSDTKYLTGSHPAVCGWDITYIEVDAAENIDGEPFDVIRKHIIAAYNRGAVNTICWHCTNPVSMGTAWDGTRAVFSIIPGGEKHEIPGTSTPVPVSGGGRAMPRRVNSWPCGSLPSITSGTRKAFTTL